MEHFEFTSSEKIKYSRTLYQIRALVDFKDIKKGDLGGWVEKGATINEGCWVYEDAIVLRGAVVHGGVIRGGTIWGGEIRGGIIYGGVIRGGVIWDGVIRGGTIWGGVIWGGVIYGGVIHSGVIRGGEIRGGGDVITFCNVGSEDGTLCAYKNGCDIEVTRGCFMGTLVEFESAVQEKHGESDIGKEYQMMIEIIKLRFSGK